MDTELLKANLVIEKARLAKREEQLTALKKRIIETTDRLATMEVKRDELTAKIKTKTGQVAELQDALGRQGAS
jgi:phage host-nuclease inhibitor protein Gam